MTSQLKIILPPLASGKLTFSGSVLQAVADISFDNNYAAAFQSHFVAPKNRHHISRSPFFHWPPPSWTNIAPSRPKSSKNHDDRGYGRTDKWKNGRTEKQPDVTCRVVSSQLKTILCPLASSKLTRLAPLMFSYSFPDFCFYFYHHWEIYFLKRKVATKKKEKKNEWGKTEYD